jgi:tetratricopeptide (TPR) repeat protein
VSRFRNSQVLVATFIATGFWSPAPAAAQTQQQIDWCVNQGSAFSPDLQIGGCTASIQSGRLSGKALARAYVSRGDAYDDKEDYDRAIADYNQAIQLDPKDAGAYFSRGLAKRLKGDKSGGDADIATAKTIDPDIGN